MRIAITATGPSLDAALEPRFGRCPYFVIVDSEQETFGAIENTSAALPGGAGLQSTQMIAASGAEIVLTGNCGPNAVNALSAAGVQVVLGCSGTVREAVEQYKAGELQTVTDPSLAADSGAGVPAPDIQAIPSQAGSPTPAGETAAGGRGFGGGGGRGAGRGRGAGGGRGRGRGRGQGGNR